MMLRLLTPSEVAKRAGVTPETVRVWERQGKLRAEKTESGRRLFREHTVTHFLGKRAEKIAVGS